MPKRSAVPVTNNDDGDNDNDDDAHGNIHHGRAADAGAGVGGAHLEGAAGLGHQQVLPTGVFRRNETEDPLRAPGFDAWPNVANEGGANEGADIATDTTTTTNAYAHGVAAAQGARDEGIHTPASNIIREHANQQQHGNPTGTSAHSDFAGHNDNNKYHWNSTLMFETSFPNDDNQIYPLEQHDIMTFINRDQFRRRFKAYCSPLKYPPNDMGLLQLRTDLQNKALEYGYLLKGNGKSPNKDPGLRLCCVHNRKRGKAFERYVQANSSMGYPIRASAGAMIGAARKRTHEEIAVDALTELEGSLSQRHLRHLQEGKMPQAEKLPKSATHCRMNFAIARDSHGCYIKCGQGISQHSFHERRPAVPVPPPSQQQQRYSSQRAPDMPGEINAHTMTMDDDNFSFDGYSTLLGDDNTRESNRWSRTAGGGYGRDTIPTEQGTRNTILAVDATFERFRPKFWEIASIMCTYGGLDDAQEVTQKLDAIISDLKFKFDISTHNADDDNNDNNDGTNNNDNDDRAEGENAGATDSNASANNQGGV